MIPRPRTLARRPPPLHITLYLIIWWWIINIPLEMARQIFLLFYINFIIYIFVVLCELLVVNRISCIFWNHYQVVCPFCGYCKLRISSNILPLFAYWIFIFILQTALYCYNSKSTCYTWNNPELICAALYLKVYHNVVYCHLVVYR